MNRLPIDAKPKCSATRSGVSIMSMSSVAASVADILHSNQLQSITLKTESIHLQQATDAIELHQSFPKRATELRSSYLNVSSAISGASPEQRPATQRLRLA